MDLQLVWDWFRWLDAATGIKLTIFYDSFDRARFFNGFLTSVRLMAICVLCSVVIGIVGAWAQGSPLRLLRLAVQAYIQFFRNTPPLVQLYFFYFALGSYLRMTSDTGLAVPLVSNFTWAVIGLSLLRRRLQRRDLPRRASRRCRARRSKRPRRSATVGSRPMPT